MTAGTSGPSTAGARSDSHGAAAYDVESVRRDFPILSRSVHGKLLAYLDSAASTQKPRAVIDALTRFYEHDYSNVHRGIHYLSQHATKLYEDVRHRVRAFISAPTADEIVFVRGTTEAINLVAQSYARPRLNPGDEILVTGMEHHSNIVPWQLVGKATGATLRHVPVDDRGDIDLDEYRRLLSPKTRLVGVVHISNALGTVNPVREMAAIARERGIPTLVDGAQAAAHSRIDVQELGCDFYAFSGHKLFGPSGIGVLYGRKELLDEMEPYHGGGEMIRSVTFEESTWAAVPHKFEAGTPHLAGVIGLGAAIDYVESLGLDRIEAHESDLLTYGTERLESVEGVRLVGTARRKASILGFVMDDVHPHDIGTILDQEGIAVRAGHHCAQPVMERFGVPATVRASLSIYSTREEIDRLTAALEQVQEIFRR